MKVKKWWAVVAGAVVGTAAVGTGAYVAKHRKRRKNTKVNERVSAPKTPVDTA